MASGRCAALLEWAPVTFTLKRRVDAKARQLYDDLVAKVNRVLYDEWAPIGFVGALPGDEYETTQSGWCQCWRGVRVRTILRNTSHPSRRGLGWDLKRLRVQWQRTSWTSRTNVVALRLNMSIDTDPQQHEAAPPLVLVVRSSSR